MRPSKHNTGFSLVEVTLALGVAAVSLLGIMALLPVAVQTNRAAIQQTTANGILSSIISDIRTVPKGAGNNSKQYKLVFPNVHNGQPRFLYFSNEGSAGSQTNGQKADKPSTDPPTTFYAIIEYMPDAAGNGSKATLMHVKVAWPYAGVTPPTAGPTPAGSVETFLTLDRD